MLVWLCVYACVFLIAGAYAFAVLCMDDNDTKCEFLDRFLFFCGAERHTNETIFHVFVVKCVIVCESYKAPLHNKNTTV